MKKLITVLAFTFFTLNFASNITIPENHYRIDDQKKMIICNAPLDSFAFDSDHITLKINNIDFQVLDPVKTLEVGKKYTIINPESINERYSVYFTDLPILHIAANSPIVDKPKVLSTISIIDNNGTLLTSNAGIEYRGSSSQIYPKKSFEIEFWNDTTGDDEKDISLFGMREDSGWNLQALYPEPLKIRSTTAWDLWAKINPLSYIDLETEAKNFTDIQYIEVFENNTYLGIFALSEKMDRKQLKLKKNNGSEIKGELYKADIWGNVTLYYGLENIDNNLDTWGGYEYKHPKDIIDWTNLYNLHDFVLNSNQEEFNTNYADKYEVDNLIDYFIFVNTINAFDNIGKNLYVAKYDLNGKYFFVPWDLDAILGRHWKSTILEQNQELITNGLYNKLMQDTRTGGFKEQLSSRWTKLRSEIITTDYIMSLLIENSSLLKNQGVYKREQITNPGSTIETEAEELAYIRSWLIDRIEYLDEEFDFTPDLNTSENSKNNTDIIFYPNPAKSYIYFLDKEKKTDYNTNIEIYSIDGKLIKSVSNHSFKESIYVGDLPKGIYFISFTDKNSKKINKKLILN